MPLSGKTAAAKVLKDEGYTMLDMGDIVRIEMEKQGISAGNEGKFVNGLRDKHGMDAIAQLCLPYLEEMLNEKEKIVITGMRSLDEKRRFENETGERVEMIAVWSSPKTRRQRREERQREEDRKGQEFQERDQRELDNGVGDLTALSDHLVKNEGTIEELEEKVLETVQEE